MTQIIGPVVALGEDGAGASAARPHMRQLNGVERGQVGFRVLGLGMGLAQMQHGALAAGLVYDALHGSCLLSQQHRCHCCCCARPKGVVCMRCRAWVSSWRCSGTWRKSSCTSR